MSKSNGVILGSAKVSDGFQISIIKEIRPHLQVKPGDRLRFRLQGNNIIIEKQE